MTTLPRSPKHLSAPPRRLGRETVEGGTSSSVTISSSWSGRVGVPDQAIEAAATSVLNSIAALRAALEEAPEPTTDR